MRCESLEVELKDSKEEACRLQSLQKDQSMNSIKLSKEAELKYESMLVGGREQIKLLKVWYFMFTLYYLD